MNKLINNLINWFGIPILAVYIFSMLIFPWFDGGGDWDYAQRVWDRWQGLNVGMLALASSIVAFKVAKRKSEDEREANFKAALAFLPQEFSDLTAYCKASMAILASAWPYAEDQEQKDPSEFKAKIPKLPEGYKEIFQDYIKFSQNEFGKVLVKILRNLQVHHARISGLVLDLKPGSGMMLFTDNLIASFYQVAEIQALINKNFNYARGLEPFSDAPLEYEDFRNALGANGVHIEDFDGLEGFIQRDIERKAKKQH